MHTKNIYIVSCFLLLLSAMSCSNDNVGDSMYIRVNTINVIGVPLINGIISDETLDLKSIETRSTSLGTGNSSSIAFQKGDTVGIFPANDFQIPFSLPVADGAAETYSDINAKAWDTKKGQLYAVYLPWVFENRHYDKIPWDYRHVQKEKGHDTRDHLGKYWFLASDTVSAAVDALGISHFQASLVCMGAIIRAQCIVPVAADYRRVMLVAQNKAFATHGYYDLFDVTNTKEDVLHQFASDPIISIPYLHQPFHALGYTDHVTLDLQSAPRDPANSSNKVLTVYFAVPETDLRYQLLTLYLWDSAGNLYYGTTKLVNPTQGYFCRNSIRNISFTNMQPTSTLNVSLNPWEKDENICPTCTPVAF